MKSEWSKAERSVLEKLTLAALAVHYISGLERGTYRIAETRQYWANAKSDPGSCADIIAAETQAQHTTERVWELVRDAESHFARLERMLSGETAIENKAISAVNNEWTTQEETGHKPDAAIAVQNAIVNAASYAAEIGEEYNHEIECTPEQLRKAIVKQYRS